MTLNKPMNIHHTSKKGCEHIIYHFQECCNTSSFNIQILEVLEGSRYTETGELDKEMTEKRLEREQYWIKILRTYYPYGFNDHKKKSEKFTTIGSLF